MKKTISIYILSMLLGVSAALAQLNRSDYPKPGPAPEINIGEPATFTLPNGLKVFVVENHKLPRIAYTLVLDRNPILAGNKAGLDQLIGQVLMGGTAKRSKTELDEAIDQIGASISVSSNSASAASLKKHNDQLLDLFAEVLFQPAFSEEELDKSKKQLLSVLAMGKDNPESILGVVSSAVMYGKDHPYGESATEETVDNISIEDIRNFYHMYFRPNIAYLAIVGDITVAEAKESVTTYFESWSPADVPRREWHRPDPISTTQINLVNRPASQQSVVEVAYPVDLRPNNPDVIGVSVISRILGGGSSGRLFMNLREDKAYTYGAYGRISSDRLIGKFSASASVGTSVTDSAAQEFLYELDRLQNKTITQEELDLAKAALAGSFARSLERPSTIANFAINTALYDLPADYYKNYLKNLDAITLDQANTLAAKYFRPDRLQITIVGNSSGFSEAMKRFGKVQYYTVEGDPEVKAEITDKTITPEAILNKYLDAIGGTEKLKAVETIKISSEAEVQGMKLGFVQAVDRQKGLAVQNTQMGGQMIAQVKIENDKVTMSAQGQTQDIPAEQAGAYLTLIDIFPELYYTARGYDLSLDGITKIDNEDAYVLKAVSPEGRSTVEYYSTASGLKLKSESETAGEISYGSYVEHKGILFPKTTTVVNKTIPFPVKTVVGEILINEELNESDFR